MMCVIKNRKKHAKFTSHHTQEQMFSVAYTYHPDVYLECMEGADGTVGFGLGRVCQT